MNVSSIAALVKQSVDILDVIGQAVQLRRAGNRHIGLCPFHQEKTPSFQVDVENQLYYCFGCGSGGDVLSFVMRHQNMSFGDALKYLADRYHIALPERDDAGGMRGGAIEESRKEKERLYEVSRIASDYFYRQLQQSKAGRAAREYVQRRGLPDEVVERERLGVALPQWDGLLTHLRSLGIEPELGVKAGLLGQSPGGSGRIYDRFRNRLIFPITDERGRVVAFGGRSLSAETQDEPKYLNSPETPIYHKGRMLYQLARARSECGQVRQVVLVEGYMDLLAFHARGFHRVVATLGTALTIHQVRLLTRMVDEVILAYDGDDAGERAMLKALPLFLQQEMAVSCVRFPDGMDPDDFLGAKGLEGFLALIGKRRDLGVYALGKTLEAWDGTTGSKAKTLSSARALLGETRQSVLRAEYVRIVSERLALSENLIEKELFQGNTSAGRYADPKPAAPLRCMPQARLIEEGVVRVMLKYPEYIDEVRDSGAVEYFDEPKLKTIAETLLMAPVSSGERLNAGAAYDLLPSPESQELFSRLLLESSELDEAGTQVREWLKRLCLRKEQKESMHLQESLRRAEEEGDTARAFKILEQIRNLHSAKKRFKDTPDNV